MRRSGLLLGGLGIFGMAAFLASSSPPVRLAGWPLPIEAIESIGDALGAARAHGPHQGVDLYAAADTPVVAPEDITILSVVDGTKSARPASQRAGRFVSARTGSGRRLMFMHLADVAVREGDRIGRGEPIARIAKPGTSGLGERPHLHFEVWENERPLNPISVLPRSGVERLDRVLA